MQDILRNSEISLPLIGIWFYTYHIHDQIKLKKTDLFEALESEATFEYSISCMIYSIKVTLVLRQEPVS